LQKETCVGKLESLEENTLITIDGNSLTIEHVVCVARRMEKVKISENAIKNIEKSRAALQEIIKSNKPVYGINTGFGIFANIKLPFEDTVELNHNLILSHAIGVGEYFPQDVIRAAILIRANTLAKGYSGVRPVIVQNLVEMLNRQITPRVQSQGSLGSSGDLCLLAQLALVLTKDQKDKDEESGSAWFNGKVYSGKKAMHLAGINREICQSKEGLALINGATFSAALGALAVFDAFRVIQSANLALSMSMESLRARTDMLDERVHHLRGMAGQIQVAKDVEHNLENSSFVNTNEAIQDAYSIRCAPQVHGGVLDTVNHAQVVISKEINAVTDNPIVFPDETVISGGNFHGEPIGFVLDFLNIALSELGAISERRTARLLDEATNFGLPAMLVDHNGKSGLQSGLMILQYTAASLNLENKLLASPASIHSLPTSANQEDHNANCTTAARHSMEIIKNIEVILAIEVFCDYRAINILIKQDHNLQLGKNTNILFTNLQQTLEYDIFDHNFTNSIESVTHELGKLFLK